MLRARLPQQGALFRYRKNHGVQADTFPPTATDAGRVAVGSALAGVLRLGRSMIGVHSLRSPAFQEATPETLTVIEALYTAKASELSAAIKAQIATGSVKEPNETVLGLQRECRKLSADFQRAIRHLQRAAGISEREIRELERIENSGLIPGLEFRLSRCEIEDVQPDSEDLDVLLKTGLDELLRLVDPEWLEAEARKPYRLGASFLNNPLHLVNGARLGTGLPEARPQRFAQMLLVGMDRLAARPDTDFFASAMFVPELAMIGNSLHEIKTLGPEAERKLKALASMPDEMVSSTIYELLVGSAGVKAGLKITMVPEDRTRRVPDYRVDGFEVFAGAIECKRRLGLTAYEVNEAHQVEALYSSVRPSLLERGVHGSIELSFTAAVATVPEREFSETVLAATADARPCKTGWGSVAFSALPHRRSINATFLYSPNYLEQVFDWKPIQDEWDGLMCEVESPAELRTELYTMPICLKWKTETEEALTRKARGITSLWASAIRQIPDGDVGFVYIAYPEGSRPALADARTKHIMDTMPTVFHRWSVRVPATIVNRVYPRPLGHGRPDLIENVLCIASKGQEFWLPKLPHRVFTAALAENH